VDTSTNLYKDLGVDKNASPQQIEQTYQKKSEELKKQNTPQAKQELALVDRAHEALKTPERKQTYDQTGAEPAVTYRAINRDTYYIKMSRFSPTLLQELQVAASSTPSTANSLILDLRGNIGGAIDQLPYVLGDFIGTNQTAFNFYQQGNYIPFPSTNSVLAQFGKFKNTVILTDNQVQSSTEMMISALKRLHYGTVVGAPTKGWGSVEYNFPLQNQIDSSQTYSVFLVRYLTLADDNQPIEGHGVQPDVNVNDKNWQTKLLNSVHSASLTTTVKDILDQ
jgi:C-terminal processing protease CtpA/Prc